MRPRSSDPVRKRIRPIWSRLPIEKICPLIAVMAEELTGIVPRDIALSLATTRIISSINQAINSGAKISDISSRLRLSDEQIIFIINKSFSADYNSLNVYFSEFNDFYKSLDWEFCVHINEIDQLSKKRARTLNTIQALEELLLIHREGVLMLDERIENCEENLIWLRRNGHSADVMRVLDKIVTGKQF